MRSDWRQRATSDRGSAAPALELVLVTPMILLIILVGIATGRATTGQSRVAQAASAGARAASAHHTAVEADQAARSIVAQTLHDQGIDCKSTTIAVDTSGITTPPGLPAHVSVTVQCTVAWSDLEIPGWPGSHTVTATAASPLDPRREVP